MVCIPCIILPVALWIYMKFIQPLILRILPQAWREKVDNWLYPTCPVKAPPTKKSENSSTEGKNDEKNSESLIDPGRTKNGIKTDAVKKTE